MKLPTNNKDRYLDYSLWNCPRVNATRPHWWLVNIACVTGYFELMLGTTCPTLMCVCCEYHKKITRDHFVYVPNEWETLQCNVSQCNVSHWLGTYTKWSLITVKCPEFIGLHQYKLWLYGELISMWSHQHALLVFVRKNIFVWFCWNDPGFWGEHNFYSECLCRIVITDPGKHDMVLIVW